MRFNSKFRDKWQISRYSTYHQNGRSQGRHSGHGHRNNIKSIMCPPFCHFRKGRTTVERTWWRHRNANSKELFSLKFFSKLGGCPVQTGQHLQDLSVLRQSVMKRSEAFYWSARNKTPILVITSYANDDVLNWKVFSVSIGGGSRGPHGSRLPLFVKVNRLNKTLQNFGSIISVLFVIYYL